MKVTILGSGTSTGVPVIGCACRVCRSKSPRDRRSRCSVLVQESGLNILIDTSIDLREQMLRHNVDRIDAILFTHPHADHIFGLDDVRRYNLMQGGPIPCYGDDNTLKCLQRAFGYAFRPGPPGGAVPQVNYTVVEEPFDLQGTRVIPIPVWHGPMRILAYRIGDFAYVVDTNRIDEPSLELLKGVRTLVLDGLRPKPHPTHYSIPQAVEIARRIGANCAYLTHLTHDVLHEELEKELPQGVRPAYDGLAFSV